MVTAFVTHPVLEDLLHGKATPEETAVFAVAGDHPVGVVQHVGGAEGGGFLTHVLGEGAHATGALQLEGDLVEFSADHHVLVELEEVLIGDEVFSECLVERTVFVENRNVVDVGFETDLTGFSPTEVDLIMAPMPVPGELVIPL